MRVFNASTMLGRPDREQRLVWGQSAVPVFAGSAAKPLSLLRLRLPHQLRQLGDIHGDPPGPTVGCRVNLAAEQLARVESKFDIFPLIVMFRIEHREWLTQEQCALGAFGHRRTERGSRAFHDGRLLQHRAVTAFVDRRCTTVTTRRPRSGASASGQMGFEQRQHLMPRRDQRRSQ